MRLGQWFTVAFLFVTLLAVGLQCEDPDHHGRRSRRNQRRLRAHFARHIMTTTAPRQSTNGDESAPDINKTERDVEQEAFENGTNETDMASPTLSTYHYHTRLRSKQARLFRIQMQILRKLGLRRTPNVTSLNIPTGLPFTERFETDMEHLFNYGEDVVERFQFIRPSCELPRRSDSHWHAEKFRLLFQFDTLNNRNRITSAFLRLFKKAVPAGCNCQSNGSPGSRLPRSRNGRRRRQGVSETHVEQGQDERIRITVFKYNKPVKRERRERKTLVDSIMVERSAEGWQNLDIKQAVTAWIENPNINYGLQVQVEDMEQNELDANKVFGTLNCSQNASMPAISLNRDLLEDGLPVPSPNQTTPYMEVISTQMFASSYRKRREAPSKCELKHKMISLYDLGVSSASPEDQIKIGYCEGSCGLDTSGKQSSCRATAWETKTLTESSQGGSTDLSVYNKYSATSCSCHQGSQT